MSLLEPRLIDFQHDDLLSGQDGTCHLSKDEYDKLMYLSENKATLRKLTNSLPRLYTFGVDAPARAGSSDTDCSAMRQLKLPSGSIPVAVTNANAHTFLVRLANGKTYAYCNLLQFYYVMNTGLKQTDPATPIEVSGLGLWKDVTFGPYWLSREYEDSEDYAPCVITEGDGHTTTPKGFSSSLERALQYRNNGRSIFVAPSEANRKFTFTLSSTTIKTYAYWYSGGQSTATYVVADNGIHTVTMGRYGNYEGATITRDNFPYGKIKDAWAEAPGYDFILNEDNLLYYKRTAKSYTALGEWDVKKITSSNATGMSFILTTDGKLFYYKTANSTLNLPATNDRLQQVYNDYRFEDITFTYAYDVWNKQNRPNFMGIGYKVA